VEGFSVLWRRPSNGELASLDEESEMEVIVPPTDTGMAHLKVRDRAIVNIHKQKSPLRAV